MIQYLLAEPTGTVNLEWLDSTHAASLHAVRGLLFNCEHFGEGDFLWDEVVIVANRTVGTMSSARQKPLWDAFLGSPCYATLSPVHRDWLQLFAYTAARAAPEMATLGAKMLADGAAATPRQWTFLVTAAATPQLATGQPETARETIVRNWKYLDQRTRDWPTMELLLRLSQAQ